MKKMKQKLLTAAVTGALALCMVSGAGAEQKEQVNVVDQNKNLVKSVVFLVGRSEYFVDNKVPGVKMDAAPYIKQGRTFVPVRFLANALGVPNEKIDFDNNLVTLDAGNTVAKMTIGRPQIITNEKVTGIDVSPEITSSRTFLPARFVAEALGYQVDFIDGLVVCYPAGTEKPDISAIKDYLNTNSTSVTPGQKSVVDVTTTGEPLSKYSWGKDIRFADKIVFINMDDLNKNSYEIYKNESTVTGLKVTVNTIIVSQITPGQAGCPIYLVDDDGLTHYRPGFRRDMGTPGVPRDFTYDVVDNHYDYGKRQADISKVKYIVVASSAACLAIENPLYQGGK
ncbi:copper amine oxidase N-terminal domain-containing protein [Desulfotomaculum nigrificans]|uniref:copper amine oxidase N-terminal domain-containing protein n=1 Tax=Desulfotomaculum nigrificans TaxID=1565 RepID=UPI0001FAE7D1|nr:copper amine oxidase N-terminal domain-containing protein [Desulfotomaculum nigrificans]